MTLHRVRQFLPIFKKQVKKGVKITVNMRLPKYHDPLLRAQAWLVTEELKKSGVRVWFFHNMNHRKIAVMDKRVLWEGSLNILSQNNSAEIMRRIESTTLAKQMVRFLGL
jgi:phosphatidylserine/phosphatidylglycerophosphate/cardiolipin synthase-like enzyme